MGYRSDVMALIYADVADQDVSRSRYAQLKLLMATTFKEVSDSFGRGMTWMDGPSVLKFEFNDIKWYESYPDVIAFEWMLAEFANADEDGIEGYCTEFIRVGEEANDVEQRHSGDHNEYHLCVRRTIDCNV